MTGTRHQRSRHVAPFLVRSVRDNGFPFAFLAFIGLVGPAWALRDQAAPLLTGPEHRAPAVEQDERTSPPTSDQ